MTFKNILPAKRFDENFKEVVKPTKPYHYDINAGQIESQEQTYNQAQQRKVLVPLSQMWKLTMLSDVRPIIPLYGKYVEFVTQPITEKSLEGLECFDRFKFPLTELAINHYQKQYKTIEHAINDGVLFILKD